MLKEEHCENGNRPGLVQNRFRLFGRHWGPGRRGSKAGSPGHGDRGDEKKENEPLQTAQDGMGIHGGRLKFAF